MMRKVLACFFIIGMVLIEYGCGEKPGGGGPDRYYEVVGIQGTQLREIDSLGFERGIIKDSASFNYFKVQTEFISEFVAIQAKKNAAVYAAPVPSPTLRFPLDSIVIKNVTSLDSLDVTADFEMGTRYYSEYKIKITNDSIFRNETRYQNLELPGFMDFYLSKEPEEPKTYHLQITFYASNGDIFETKTEQFMVKP